LHIVVATLAWTLLVSAPASAAGAANDPRNFEGTWRRADREMAASFILGIDLPYKPETQNLAADHLQWFKEGRSKASAHLTCRPTGVQGVTATKEAVLFLQPPMQVIMISQEDREVRHVYLGQSHPKNIKPTYSGHSVGHWDGDTLVIDTIGYNGKGQLDEMGNPHSDQLHVVERWSKSADGNTLTAEFTITDPVYYTRAFTKTRQWRRSPGTRIADYDCGENPRSDDFDNLRFENDWFKPTCVREVKDGAAADKVVCASSSKSKTE
jgi:hypothetical protein